VCDSIDAVTETKSQKKKGKKNSRERERERFGLVVDRCLLCCIESLQCSRVLCVYNTYTHTHTHKTFYSLWGAGVSPYLSELSIGLYRDCVYILIPVYIYIVEMRSSVSILFALPSSPYTMLWTSDLIFNKSYGKNKPFCFYVPLFDRRLL
jgi:hypothetical protein